MLPQRLTAYSIEDQFGLEHLVRGERVAPEPGRGEVLVRVHALSLNYRDLLVVRGQYNPKLPRPMVPLSDCSGEVVATGAGVTRFHTGDRVCGIFMQGWIDGLLTEEKARTALGGAIQGVAAQAVLFPEHGLVRIPEHLSYEQGATLPCAAVTVWHALIVSGLLAAGDTVLLLGTGGVSIFGLQFARVAGAHVTITSSSDAKLERARALGAHATINYKSTPEWEKVARNVDHVVEVGGAGTLGKSVRAVRHGGTVSVIGALSGAPETNITPALMKGVRLQGIFVGSRAMFEEMNRAITLHRIEPVVDRVFPFDELPDALRYMESGAHFGKIVVRVQ